jgi:hypothetical protein
VAVEAHRVVVEVDGEFLLLLFGCSKSLFFVFVFFPSKYS